MNRAARRRARRAGVPVEVAAVAASYRCPDCASEAELTRDPIGIWHLTISHDTTCPFFRTLPEPSPR